MTLREFPRNPPLPDFDRSLWYQTKTGLRFRIRDDFDQVKGSTLCVARVEFDDGTLDLLAFDAATIRPCPSTSRGIWDWVCYRLGLR